MPICNLCGFPVVRLHPGLAGRRCLRCLSTVLHRAVGRVLQALALEPTLTVYELSSRGALCRYLRRTFREVTVSELFDDVPAGAFRGSVQCQDVERLTFPDAAFDLVTSTEVFEHVADDARAFREVRRVLRPGGRLVFTVPLAEVPRTLERAVRTRGGIVHLLPPEYHHDRLRGRRRVLAFRTYGLDIVERLARAGFDASIARIDEARHAIAGAKVVVARTLA